MIVSRLLRSAIKAASSVDNYDTIDPAEYTDALESCNMMLALWATKGLVVHHTITEQLSLIANQGSYTIGADGNFDTSRPNRLVGGFVRDSNNNDYPISIIDREEYNGLTNKNTTGIPRKLYIYPAFPLSTIYVYYVPDVNYTLSLDSLKPITVLELDSTLNLPPEYEEAIKWNLAVRLAPDYKQAPRPDVIELADNAYKALSTQPIPLAYCEGVPGLKTHNGAGSINNL